MMTPNSGSLLSGSPKVGHVLLVQQFDKRIGR